MSLAATTIPVSLPYLHCSRLPSSTSLSSGSPVLATSSRQHSQVRSAVTRMILLCLPFRLYLSRSRCHDSPWHQLHRCRQPFATVVDQTPVHSFPLSGWVRVWGLGVLGAWGPKKGSGNGECRVSKMSASSPFVILIYFFSFILLLQLVLLIYYFKPKYPRINGNVLFINSIILYWDNNLVKYINLTSLCPNIILINK